MVACKAQTEEYVDGNEHLRQCTFAESFKLNEYDGVGYSLGGGGGGTLVIFEWGCAAGTLEPLV